MEYTMLGGTGRKVSRLGFGGAPAGLRNYLAEFDPDSAAAQDAVISALQRALELGVTYFDTAPGYGQGAGETLFGRALEGAGNEIFVASKYGFWQKGTLRQSVEESLARLRRPRLDLLQLHGTSWTSEQVTEILRPGGLADQMAALRDEGLIAALGFTSEDNNDAVYALLRSGRFDVMQICYNFVNQHPHDPRRPFGSMLEANKAGLGIVTMRTTTSGVFQRWMRLVRPDDDFNYIPALIAFVLSNPLVDVALVGMRTVAEVEANVALADDQSARVDLAAVYNYFAAPDERQ